MFRKNQSTYQPSLFSFENQLSPKLLSELQQTQEHSFYKLIFQNINENIFSPLYSEDKASRPNAPINCLVSALILKEKKGWSYNELFQSLKFDLRARIAIGLNDFDNNPFCRASLFNFQNRLFNHFLKEGETLIEKIFDNLTKKQLKELKIKTDIQRSDSFLVHSNIKNYSRIQLLVEGILRLHKILSKEDKNHFSKEFEPYLKQNSEHFVYQLKSSEITHKISEIGNFYNSLYETFKSKYIDNETFKLFERIFNEHFKIVDKKVELIPSQELSSNILQSIDDPDATFRKKRKEQSKGYSINIVETANPENAINLLTDVCVEKNNVDDSKILNKRLDKIVKKTPLKELHTDGAYGSKANDEKMQELGIKHVQTAVKGRKSTVSIEIEQVNEKEYKVTCPNQEVISTPTNKRHKASFDLEVCNNCPFSESCPTQKQKTFRVLYFDNSTVIAKQRHNNINQIPEERRNLRPNVEASVQEFKHQLNNGKLKVRKLFRVIFFALNKAIGINFGRIYRYLAQNSFDFINWVSFFLKLLSFCINFVVHKIKFGNYSNSNIKLTI